MPAAVDLTATWKCNGLDHKECGIMTSTTVREPMSAGMLLRENPVTDLRRVDIAESEHEVILSGIVTSYYLKQMAQETIRPVLAGRRLKNRLLVLSPK
jgi:hypothetical protein